MSGRQMSRSPSEPAEVPAIGFLCNARTKYVSNIRIFVLRSRKQAHDAYAYLVSVKGNQVLGLTLGTRVRLLWSVQVPQAKTGRDGSGVLIEQGCPD